MNDLKRNSGRPAIDLFQTDSVFYHNKTERIQQNLVLRQLRGEFAMGTWSVSFNVMRIPRHLSRLYCDMHFCLLQGSRVLQNFLGPNNVTTGVQMAHLMILNKSEAFLPYSEFSGWG